MSWIQHAQKASKVAAGWSLVDVEVPTEVVEKLLRQRLEGRERLVVRRKAALRHSYEVSTDHWWFRRWCSAYVELSTPKPSRTRLSWKRLRWGRGTMSPQGLTLTLLLALVPATLLVMILPSGSWSLVAAALLFFASTSPSALLTLTAGGPRNAEQLEREFSRRLERAVSGAIHDAHELEANSGQLAIASGDISGYLSPSSSDHADDAS